MSNYVAARVVAVPVCRPARPARAHPSLGVPSGLVEHGVCTWKCIIRGWKRNVCRWQHLICGLKCIALVWKRRCADVRAGTQAPPLRFGLGKPQKIKLGLAGSSANDKKRFWDLPAVRQTTKKDFETCRRFGKRQKKILGLAEGLANGKKIFWDLPAVRQTSKK